MEFINNKKNAAMEPLARLAKNFANSKNLAGQVEAIYAFLEELKLDRRLDQLAQEMDRTGDNRSAQILNQLWEILIGAMEQLYGVLGDTVWETEHFVSLFQLLLSQYDVGTIPPVLDAVQVGAVSAQRLHEQKHLIVLGAKEGNLPGYSGTTGVLTDQERVTLRQLGVPLTGGNLEGIQAEFAEIYGVFCGATESISVYCSGEQPSFVYRRLLEMSGREQGVEVPFGYLDITKHRDDLTAEQKEDTVAECHIPCDIREKNVIIVDDVMYTGRTARAALEAVFAFARPQAVQLAVLVDRGHRELPIRPDYVGKNVPTSRNEAVAVRLSEVDGETAVYICDTDQ
jgi:pyrimidine operon attenuation protein/uracil phosphoribosyltransferase